MRDNGTDRDVALQILSALDSTATLVETIKNNLYHAHIITQPTDYTGAVDTNFTFTVVAANVTAYRWQRQTSPGGNFQNLSTGGSNTASLSQTINSDTYTYQYRCRLTGPDGEYVFTDVVKVINPDS